MYNFYYYDDDLTALGIFDSIVGDEFNDSKITLITTTKNAVATILKNDIDILFLDLHITPFEGMIVFEEVHAKKPNTPIVFISAGIQPGEVEWARINGLTACIEKPVSPKSLVDLIHKILDSKTDKFYFMRSTNF
ncbi:MAG: response regulator [Phototrophicaceae bacterium]